MVLTFWREETGKGWLININKETIGFDIKHSYAGTILAGQQRGEHYHKECKERLICLRGIITVKLCNIDFSEPEAFEVKAPVLKDDGTPDFDAMTSEYDEDIDLGDDDTFLRALEEINTDKQKKRNNSAKKKPDRNPFL